DTNIAEDIFVHDRGTGTTMRASIASDGTQADNMAFGPDLNGNGHLVAFSSFASNLVGNDNDDTVDVFVHDFRNGETEESGVAAGSIGVTNHGNQANISTDGRFVVFDTQATDLFPDANGPIQDVVLFDRVMHTYEVVSVNDAGEQGNDISSNPVVNANGRFVEFTSIGTNVVSDDTNNREDVFVRDLQ